ncbi:MAG: peptidoglycan DD-metalloendopeptidase family protein [Solirubrobacterales bacterium]
MSELNPLSPRSVWTRLLFVLVAVGLSFVVWAQSPARATVEERLSETEERLAEFDSQRGVLSEEISSLSARIKAYEAQVAALRAEERKVEIRLAGKQAELDRAQDEFATAFGELEVLAERLERSLVILSDRLVAIYQSGSTDITDLVLISADYGELIEQSEYLEHIQNQDETIINRVRDLRDQQQAVVVQLKAAKEKIESARDAIAAEELNLATARRAVQSQQSELSATRGQRQSVLDGVDERAASFEEVRADLQAKIQEQIAAASGLSTLPAGPMSAPSAAGLIWPLSGTLTSGFGYRWGRMHEGIDISVPEGTPIRSAKGGTVIMASYNGGYGNYTCVDHGSGLSTCYAHQSGFVAGAGQSVDQGQIIGYSGNTGSSTGPHLHFEVRVNGAAQDPMGYL